MDRRSIFLHSSIMIFHRHLASKSRCREKFARFFAWFASETRLTRCCSSLCLTISKDLALANHNVASRDGTVRLGNYRQTGEEISRFPRGPEITARNRNVPRRVTHEHVTEEAHTTCPPVSRFSRTATRAGEVTRNLLFNVGPPPKTEYSRRSCTISKKPEIRSATPFVFHSKSSYFPLAGRGEDAGNVFFLIFFSFLFKRFLDSFFSNKKF